MLSVANERLGCIACELQAQMLLDQAKELARQALFRPVAKLVIIDIDDPSTCPVAGNIQSSLLKGPNGYGAKTTHARRLIKRLSVVADAGISITSIISVARKCLGYVGGKTAICIG